MSSSKKAIKLFLTWWHCLLTSNDNMYLKELDEWQTLTISSMLSVLHTSLHCLPFAETLGILVYLTQNHQNLWLLHGMFLIPICGSIWPIFGCSFSKGGKEVSGIFRSVASSRRSPAYFRVQASSAHTFVSTHLLSTAGAHTSTLTPPTCSEEQQHQLKWAQIQRRFEQYKT